MTQIEARFVKSINGSDTILFDRKPHIVFIGRSNVGKSSLINSLCNRKNLARSSSTPGKTNTIDFFDINSKYYFVDLPGYGFAHADNKTREHYRKLIFWYIAQSGIKPALVILILDTKVGVTEYDQETISLLIKYDIPFCMVANKIDKLKQNERLQKISFLQHLFPTIQIIPHSIKTGEGRKELLHRIFATSP